MVGDEKQSIYGFRGCVPEFFQEKLEDMQRNGEKTVLLHTNFRSAKSVIDGVNQVFSYCMTDRRYGLDYSKKSKLVLCDKYGEYYGRARLDILEIEKPPTEIETPRIYDIREEALKEETTEDDITVSMANALTSVTSNPTVLLFLVVLFLVVCGMFMETTVIALILTPILLPVMRNIGVNEVVFGMIMMTTVTFGGS